MAIYTPRAWRNVYVDANVAKRLADRLQAWQHIICTRVTTRLLVTYPELVRTLRLESVTSVEERLSQVSVVRLYELVRAILLFDLPELADKELAWAYGVLPRSGVTFEHQASMIAWFFDEIQQLGIEPDETIIVEMLKQRMLDVMQRIYDVV